MFEAREKAIQSFSDKIETLENKLAVCNEGRAQVLTLEHDGLTYLYSDYLKIKIAEYKCLIKVIKLNAVN